MASGTGRQFLSMPKSLPGVRPHFVVQELADHPLLQILTSLQVLLATSSRLGTVVRVRSNLNHFSSGVLRFGKRGGSDATFEQHLVKWLVVGWHASRTRGAVRARWTRLSIGSSINSRTV